MMTQPHLRRRHFLSLLLTFTTFVCLSSAGEENLYKILGVKRTATTKEIKRAYRKKALDTHPDKRKDIPPEQAAAEFHRVVQAFETLSDEQSRRAYDRHGQRQSSSSRRSRSSESSGSSGWNWGWDNSWNSYFQWGSNSGGTGGYRRNPPGYQWRSDRPRKLKDQFKVRECMSRVMHIVSLAQLETVMLDENGLLERNLLMVFVTPGDVERIVDDDIVFPYPFAAMSEQGIWWEDLLQTAKIRYHKQTELTKFFMIPHGDETRQITTPTFLFGRRGQPLAMRTFNRLQTQSREEFDAWMWRQIEVTVNFKNEHHHPVELFWIHGSRAHEKGVLQPGESAQHTTMLTHEWWVRDSRVDQRKDSPGRHKLTKESMVAVWKIKSDEHYRELVIPPKSCIDLSGHCTWWKGQGECRKNPRFMEEVCPLTCKHCSEDNDKFKSYDHAEF